MTNKPLNLNAITKSLRVPFLILSPICVFLGAATVIQQQSINLYILALAMAGALLAHIAVNTLNEYDDFKSGLDFLTQKTAFSGGSGSLPNNPEHAHIVLSIGITSLVATALIGVFFMLRHGIELLPLGLLGIFIIVAYTGWINKHPILCLLAPGVGFGVLMVVGTQFVLQGHYAAYSLFVAIIPFSLANNLLLLNQYPDIEADRRIGRHHLPIAYGVKVSNIIYAFFVFITLMTIVSGIVLNYFPTLSVIALLPLIFSFYALSGALKYGEQIGHYPQYLGANVTSTILTPILLSISLIIG
ncbi:MAG: prenyltransferase [Cycloclasticus sp.]|jgi:1,4-dihydroxy-2-naphthoate octaprenyltransferase|nr:prenyltransferase [Cycloclasticus sp.]